MDVRLKLGTPKNTIKIKLCTFYLGFDISHNVRPISVTSVCVSVCMTLFSNVDVVSIIGGGGGGGSCGGGDGGDSRGNI
jgi:hypothetical protein